MTELRPLREADFSKVEAVFTDVDGTLTTAGKLRASTLGALERLDRAGVPVVLVTGRPAGFAEAWARTLPVSGVIAENGGISVRIDGRGALRLWRGGWVQSSGLGNCRPVFDELHLRPERNSARTQFPA